MDFAKANGMKTLEMTTTWKVLEMTTKITSYKFTKPFWEMASRSFAEGAQGTAHFFTIPTGPSSMSIWLTLEKPILEKNGVSIITHIVP